MSDTILTGDFTVYYIAENRQKRIVWTGAATGTRTMTELYDALMDLFDEALQMDDGSPMDYDIPTEFKTGILDSGSLDPWFIDRTTVEHLTGGSLKTLGWARVTSSNVGIVKFAYTVGAGTDLVTGDIGKTIASSASSDSGTLLDFKTDGSNGVMWIRPADDTATHDWDGTPSDITVSGGTGLNLTQDAASTTGESIWANYTSIGTVDGIADTHLYAEQDGAQVVAYKGTDDWWPDGHVDAVFPVQELGTLFDEGVVKWHARQFTKTYGFFEVTDTTGKQNPVPLSAGDDIANEDGYRSTTTTSSTSAFEVGEVFGNNASRGSATKLGIVTAISGTNPTVTLEYYLIGDLTDFVASDALTGYTSSATATAGAPSNVNAATYSDITYTFTADNTIDIDQNDTNEYYAIKIDLNNRTLAQMHARNQYLTRRGETATLDTQEGQFYIGLEWVFNYDSIVGTVAEGSVVTQVSSGAVGTVVSHDTVNKLVSLRTTRGTFVSNQNVELDGSNRYVQPLTNLTQVAPKAVTTGTPFGNLAGSSFFGAYGVVLTSVASADANNYTVTDLTGGLYSEPLSVTLAVTNTRALDRIAVWRLTGAGGSIDTAEHTIDATQGGVNSTSVVVEVAIPQDVPGKSTGGIIRVLDVSSGYSERYRYTAYTSDTFTLFTTTQSAATGGSQTSLEDSGANFVTDNVEVGDIVYNVTEDTYAYVTVVAATTLTMSNDGSENPVTDWNGDTYHVGATVKAYVGGTDTAYVPFIDVEEDTGTAGSPGSESQSIVYLSDIPIRVVARQKGDIKPFSTDSTVQSTGASIAVIRTPDTVAT